METASEVSYALENLRDPRRGEFMQRFFKTGKGEYAEGDYMLGVPVPAVRKLAALAQSLPLPEVVVLLQSPYHEARLCALIIMVARFRKADTPDRTEIFTTYLSNTARINNWDLVDVSARDIVGGYLENRPRDPLYLLARSASLWERRISIVATWYFIREEQFDDTLRLASILISDSHDLIHKASGWMLREVGKRSRLTLVSFLDREYRRMPRTMLRYAIEKLPGELRTDYLTGKR